MPTADKTRSFGRSVVRPVGKIMLKVPVYLYRWTLKPLIGWPCRHAPSCSEYALDAIDKNGAWRGGWLALSRLTRCHPWGSHGFDPAPDITSQRHLLAPWRYGRWTGKHISERDIEQERLNSKSGHQRGQSS